MLTGLVAHTGLLTHCAPLVVEQFAACSQPAGILIPVVHRIIHSNKYILYSPHPL